MTAPLAPTRLILVRHGEPCESVHGRCYGRLDPPLSRAGREQMAALARHLAPPDDWPVVSSPLRRAVESAALLGADVDRMAVDERLRELDFGTVEGLTYAEIERAHPALFRAWMERPTDVTFPGGEPLDAMALRVRRALADLMRDRPNLTTVVVAHGGVNRILIADALGLPLASMFRLGQDYACFTIIDYRNGHGIVRVMNAPAGSPC